MAASGRCTIASSRTRIVSAYPLLFAIAETLGLSQQGLRDALASHVYAPKIQSDFLGGVRSGVNGTPTFFINDRRHDASFDFATLVAAINARLSRAQTLV
jgi:protein-disulfide isomerase